MNAVHLDHSYMLTHRSCLLIQEFSRPERTFSSAERTSRVCKKDRPDARTPSSSKASPAQIQDSNHHLLQERRVRYSQTDRAALPDRQTDISARLHKQLNLYSCHHSTSLINNKSP